MTAGMHATATNTSHNCFRLQLCLLLSPHRLMASITGLVHGRAQACIVSWIFNFATDFFALPVYKGIKTGKRCHCYCQKKTHQYKSMYWIYTSVPNIDYPWPIGYYFFFYKIPLFYNRLQYFTNYLYLKLNFSSRSLLVFQVPLDQVQRPFSGIPSEDSRLVYYTLKILYSLTFYEIFEYFLIEHSPPRPSLRVIIRNCTTYFGTYVSSKCSYYCCRRVQYLIAAISSLKVLSTRVFDVILKKSVTETNEFIKPKPC